jgi:hypothetical protein
MENALLTVVGPGAVAAAALDGGEEGLRTRTNLLGRRSINAHPGYLRRTARGPGTSSTAIPATNGPRFRRVKSHSRSRGSPRWCSRGDSNYVPRGTIHRQQNLTDKPARYIEMRIFDKDKPAAEQVAE